ncbi:TonB-dependent receptor [Methylomonas sp. EFPC1]|uniref:TonB-dependent receptor n=1 Tax=Methylomonas defluvii TaxID=3045149 RepID=A0ABU4UD30_9GAMM|nr:MULTISPECIES: TonB-dependent receptor [unclassified Methylomonas]MDX8127063.1 TonB-dependent receptor [Methylomonas sp. OY6]PKD39302.1 TonB-dependent receptor [Methylomonas sp. Kb3]QSB01143.1 TonB-dependent receptor [Methylomonas sp. EFPC1]
MKYPAHTCRAPLYVALAAGLLTPTVILSAEQTAQTFDIRSQALSSALIRFSALTGLQVLYEGDIAERITAPELIGRYTPEQALRNLLRGSGLQYRFSNGNTVTLEKAAAVEPQSAAGTTTLPTMTVTGKALASESPSLTTPSLQESQIKLNRVAGGTSVIDGKRIEEGAPLSVSDALATAPGVYVGDISAGATGGSRISIRGSDGNSDISPIRGIKFLRNGMPFTHANGTFDVEALNLYAIEHIEVYRGANALEYGGSNLGGAINYITPTGYTANGLKIGIVGGTNDYYRPYFSGGKAFENGLDVFGTFSYVNTDTTRENNHQEQFLGHGNVGYRWNENHETRLYFDAQNHNFLWPATLSKRQIDQNPQQNPNDWSLPNGFSSYRFDLKHSVKLHGGDRLDVGTYYSINNYRYDYTDSGNHDQWQDVGFNWRHEINGQLLGLNNRVVWGGLTQWQFINDKNYGIVGRQLGPLLTAERDRWLNVEAFMEDQLSLTDRFTLIAGIQLNYRDVNYERYEGYVASAARPSNQANQDFFTANPKLGFTWQATDEAQIYGNVSRSAEPPKMADLANIYLQPKRNLQTASTVEIGTRGQAQRLKWDLAFYQSWVNNEYLIVSNPRNPTAFSSTNADSTTLHRGVELGLETTLPLNLAASGDNLRLSGNYTWNDFTFDSDPALRNNRLPGIPEHNAFVEALYQHPSGFYIGPNARIVSSNYADFANTLAAKPYALLGARMGWDDGKHWKLFVDGRNLTDEHYASSVWVLGNANGADLDQFNPGATRSVFGGVEYRF